MCGGGGTKVRKPPFKLNGFLYHFVTSNYFMSTPILILSIGHIDINP